jgi:hypothetical protein
VLLPGCQERTVQCIAHSAIASCDCSARTKPDSAATAAAVWCEAQGAQRNLVTHSAIASWDCSARTDPDSAALRSDICAASALCFSTAASSFMSILDGVRGACKQVLGNLKSRMAPGSEFTRRQLFMSILDGVRGICQAGLSSRHRLQQSQAEQPPAASCSISDGVQGACMLGLSRLTVTKARTKTSVSWCAAAGVLAADYS